MQKTLLLDYDDTLHDTLSKFKEKFDGLLEMSGEQLWHLYIDEIHRNIVHRLYPEKHDDQQFHFTLLFKKLGQSYNQSIAERFIKGYREAEEASWKTPTFFPDTIPFLNTVKDKGYKLVIATGKWAEEKARTLNEQGSTTYFTHVFGEVNLGYLKNNPSYYREALRRSGSTAEQSTMIGDSLLNDIGPAKAVGVKTIWVNRRGEKPEGKQPSPNCEVRNLSEALNYL